MVSDQNSNAEPGTMVSQDLLIAGCSAPEILKLVHAINEKGSRRFNILGFIDTDGDRIREGCWSLPVWDERAISRKEFPDAAAAINVASSMDLRWKVAQNLLELGFRDIPALIHPDIDLMGVEIGEGTIIFHGVQLGVGVSIGSFSLILMGSLVNHEVTIGDCTFLGPGSIILGRAVLGDRVYIGAGAIVFPGVRIEDGAVVGAGAVVRGRVPPGATVAGCPARIIRNEPSTGAGGFAPGVDTGNAGRHGGG